MYKFNINKIVVNTSEGTKDIVPKTINVFVGPNNSGKSRFLKELRDYLSGDERDIKIIKNIEYSYPENFSELDSAYNVTSKMVKDQYGNWMLKSYSNKPSQGLDMTSSLESYFTRNMNTVGGSWMEHFSGIINRKDRTEFLNWYGSLFYQYIGTEERLTICKAQKNYGLDSSSTNYLSSFKYKDQLLNDLSCKIKQLFKKDICLDTQTLGDRLVFRVGDNFEYIKNVTNYSEDIAFRLFSESMLDDQGDGLKSFVSTFLSLNQKENDILLLDEPEAFLHPPLARQLGEMIGDFDDEERTIFVATHSVEILRVSSEFYKFLAIMPIEEKEKQRIKSYAEKLRENIEASVNVNGMSKDEAEKVRKEVRDEIYHKKGIRFFEDALKNKIQETLNCLSKYHLHILETGELETLLEEYGVTYKEKKLWIIDAINRIAELSKDDISSESRLYKFIHRIIENN